MYSAFVHGTCIDSISVCCVSAYISLHLYFRICIECCFYGCDCSRSAFGMANGKNLKPNIRYTNKIRNSICRFGCWSQKMWCCTCMPKTSAYTNGICKKKRCMSLLVSYFIYLISISLYGPQIKFQSEFSISVHRAVYLVV